MTKLFLDRSGSMMWAVMPRKDLWSLDQTSHVVMLIKNVKESVITPLQKSIAQLPRGGDRWSQDLKKLEINRMIAHFLRSLTSLANLYPYVVHWGWDSSWVKRQKGPLLSKFLARSAFVHRAFVQVTIWLCKGNYRRIGLCFSRARVRLDWLNIEWSLRAWAEARSISIHKRLKLDQS